MSDSVRSTPAAVFFDFDGVLIDSDPLWWSVIDEVLERRSILPSKKRSNRPRGLKLEEAIKSQGVCNRRTRRSIAAEVRRIAEPRIAQMSLMEGAVEAICEIGDSDVPLGVVSSSHTMLLEQVLQWNAIRSRFSVLVGGDRVRRGKPAPDGYLLAARELEVNPEHCCAVEDTSNGVDAAARAGMYAICLAHGTVDAGCNGPHRHSATVGTLRDLPEVVLAWPGTSAQQLGEGAKGLRRFLARIVGRLSRQTVVCWLRR